MKINMICWIVGLGGLMLGGCSETVRNEDRAVENRLQRDNDLWLQHYIEDRGLSVTMWEAEWPEQANKEKKIEEQTKRIAFLESILSDYRKTLEKLEKEEPVNSEAVNRYRMLTRSQELKLARERVELKKLEGCQSVFDTSFRAEPDIRFWDDEDMNSPAQDPWTRYHR